MLFIRTLLKLNPKWTSNKLEELLLVSFHIDTLTIKWTYDNDEFDGPSGFESFGMTMTDFEMPDFHSIGRTMKMLSWLPAIISFVAVTSLSFVALVVYNGLVQPDYNITYWEFMTMLVVSLLAGLITGALVKFAAGRKMRSSPGF